MKRSRLIDRRAVLKGAGVTLLLPCLEAMASPGKKSTKIPPKRMIFINVNLGLYGPAFFPTGEGRRYKLSLYLKTIEEFRKYFTVFSGLEHIRVVGGHRGIGAFLTGENMFSTVESGTLIGKQMSVDQVAGELLGSKTRFSSLQMSCGYKAGKFGGVSYGRGGVPLPDTIDPKKVFERLFGDVGDKTAIKKIYAENKSVLDRIRTETKALSLAVGHEDKEKLDSYLTSVREVEINIQKKESWLDRPPPKVNPGFIKMKPRALYDIVSQVFKLSALAFKTDSTRIITCSVPAYGEINLEGEISHGYHALSHHGKEVEKVDQLKIVESRIMEEFRKFLDELQSHKENGESLLDHTMVMLGSPMGNGSSHSNRKLPILIAGGGFKHGQHIRFKQPTALCNLYVTMLQNMGLAIDKFSSSTGNLNHVLT